MSIATQARTGRTLALAGLLALCAGPAPAQQTLQRVEVTGSHIKRADAETPAPVTVLTRQDIERTGRQSLHEVLRLLTSDGQGSIPEAFTSGFAAGSAGVSLRGMGVNSTLVLVNGRRMSTYGLADDGQRTFVDLSSLPLEAVERIEVLRGGASAVYGADAVGGVVNVILRKRYDGKSIGASYGQTGRNDGQTARAFGSVGFGDLEADRYNVFVTVEGVKQRDIMTADRGFIGQDDLRPQGFFDTRVGSPRPWIGRGSSIQTPFGVALDPATGDFANLTRCPEINPLSGICNFNVKAFQQVQPAVERLNLVSRGTLALAPSATAYAELGYFYTKVRPIWQPSAGSDIGVLNPADPLNPIIVHGPPILPPTHPDNPLGVDALLGIVPVEFGGRNDNTDNQVARLVLGLQGSAREWDYDVGLGYVESRLKDVNTGYLRASVLQQAIDDGTFRVNRPDLVPPAVLAAISPSLARTATSSVAMVDAKASREVASLPGGALLVALGAEHRREKADTPPVPFTDVGDIIGLGFSAFEAKRRVTAVFGEASAPVLPWLELNAAVRSDRYSDFGRSTTPSFGIKVRPNERFAIRATYAEAFRAPGPAELGGATLGSTLINILTIGNPDLEPEKAKIYGLGFVLEPQPGTSATVDFYAIDRRNEIVQADPAAIIGNSPQQGTPDTRIPGVQPGSFIFYDADGELTIISAPYQNAASTRTNGVEVELRHRMNLGTAGRLSGTLSWTHVNKLQRTLADGQTFDYAGTHGPIALSSGSGTPQDRATFAATYERGPWAVTGAINYVGAMKLVDHRGERAFDNGDGTVQDGTNGLLFPSNGRLDCGVFNPDGNASSDCRLGSFTTFDLFARWTPTRNLDLNFSIQNVFDRKAPFDPYLVVLYSNNYNLGWHQAGAVGRFFTVGARYSF